MLAISALDVHGGGFRAESAGADDNSRYADEMRDIGRCQAADRSLRYGRVDEELVLRERFRDFEILFTSRGVEDTLCALFEC